MLRSRMVEKPKITKVTSVDVEYDVDDICEFIKELDNDSRSKVLNYITHLSPHTCRFVSSTVEDTIENVEVEIEFDDDDYSAFCEEQDLVFGAIQVKIPSLTMKMKFTELLEQFCKDNHLNMGEIV